MKPPRLNVPALVKQHKVLATTIGASRIWAASININGQHFTCWNAPSKRKAVLDVLRQANLIQ